MDERTARTDVRFSSTPKGADTITNNTFDRVYQSELFNMDELTLTDRQRREASFYERYARLQDIDEVDFAPVDGSERRPWNPYWHVHELGRQRFFDRSQRLLDFGCGIGIAALRFAHLGYRIDGFDLADKNINIAKKLARRHNLDGRCRFQTMAAEHLSYPDNTFDVLVGIDILHHIEIRPAIEETYRVLKPGGIAIFKEHVEVPVLDPIRNTALVQSVVPNTESLDHHITPDERKLAKADLAIIQDRFDQVQIKRFTLISRFDRLVPGCSDSARARLQRLDHYLLSACPALARLAGTAVLTCYKCAAEQRIAA